jgi:hypothetical protein
VDHLLGFGQLHGAGSLVGTSLAASGRPLDTLAAASTRGERNPESALDDGLDGVAGGEEGVG